jgi:hypothetical protein
MILRIALPLVGIGANVGHIVIAGIALAVFISIGVLCIRASVLTVLAGRSVPMVSRVHSPIGAENMVAGIGGTSVVTRGGICSAVIARICRSLFAGGKDERKRQNKTKNK